jgi:hypothetical protein
MAMQFDVKATKPLTSTGDFKDQGNSSVGRARIKALYAVSGANAGSVIIADSSGGATLFTLNTPTAANSGAVNILFPGEGILAQTGLHGTVDNVASIVVIYG